MIKHFSTISDVEYADINSAYLKVTSVRAHACFCVQLQAAGKC